jgi:hypothetical protein
MTEKGVYFAYILQDNDGDEKTQKRIACGVWEDADAAAFHLKNFKRWHNGVTVRAIQLDYYHKWTDANTQSPARSTILTGRALRNQARRHGIKAVLYDSEEKNKRRQETAAWRKQRKDKAIQHQRDLEKRRAEFDAKMTRIKDEIAKLKSDFESVD